MSEKIKNHNKAFENQGGKGGWGSSISATFRNKTGLF